MILSDGVKWAIDNGYADADRVCIAGASYGGYATMAGMTFTPELYRCGINGVGVTDQMLILENFAQKRSRNQSWDKEPLLEWGDLYNEEDYAYAKASSPVNFVKDIEGAVLVLHGSNDRVVEPRHAEDLIAQLKKYDIEYMECSKRKLDIALIHVEKELHLNTWVYKKNF
jgi:dipeptidyl aminopeptidase/acylaminoacyl peptidase